MNPKNQGDLDSYLIEITRDILRHKHDDDNSKYTVDLVLDLAGQKGVSFLKFCKFQFFKKYIFFFLKGTGKWTAISALELGQPLTLIGEAV